MVSAATAIEADGSAAGAPPAAAAAAAATGSRADVGQAAREAAGGAAPGKAGARESDGHLHAAAAKPAGDGVTVNVRESSKSERPAPSRHDALSMQ